MNRNCVLLICLVLVIWLLCRVVKNNYRNLDRTIFDNLRNVRNPYFKGKGRTLKWFNSEHPFIKSNFPHRLDFDFEIKQDIVKHVMELPLNSGIIDAGAHIGDGTIPIAHALIKNNREDVTVYAIEPSEYKCEMIRRMALINNLQNVRVICKGLSDREGIYTYNDEHGLQETNSGGIHWRVSKNENRGALEGIEEYKFTTLDNLVENGEINHPIHLIHLDVEAMETKVLRGGRNLIDKYKPYLSLELNQPKDPMDGELLSKKIMLSFLPKGYRFKKKIRYNVIFIFSKRGNST